MIEVTLTCCTELSGQAGWKDPKRRRVNKLSNPQEAIHHLLKVKGFMADPPERELGSGGEASHKQTSDSSNSVKEGSPTAPLEVTHHQPRNVAPSVGHGERLESLTNRMEVEKQIVI